MLSLVINIFLINKFLFFPVTEFEYCWSFFVEAKFEAILRQEYNTTNILPFSANQTGYIFNIKDNAAILQLIFVDLQGMLM